MYVADADVKRCHITRMLYRYPSLAPDDNYFTFNNNLGNGLAAVMERVFYHQVADHFELPFEPTALYVHHALRPAFTALRSMIHPTTPMSLSGYAERYYRGRRLTIYRRAVDSFSVQGLSRRDAYLSSFLKAAKEPIKSTASPPRLIQPRKPRYNVAVGRYIRPIEPILFRLIQRLFKSGPVVMKGMNVDEVGEAMSQAWNRVSNPVAIGLDASRFDQHCSEHVLRWEHCIYRLFYPAVCHDGLPTLAELLSWQVDNKGFMHFADGKLRYRRIGCRCSGDMNTSCGNCLLMCAAVYSFMCWLGIPTSEYSLCNNGDDCVLILSRKWLSLVRLTLPSWFDQLGFVMKVEPPVFDLERVGFCQMHPVRVGSSYRMVRDLSAFGKDCVTFKDLRDPRVWDGILGAIGLCGLALTSGVPMYQAFYECMSRSSSSIITDPILDDSGMQVWARGMSAHHMPVSEPTRYSFWLAFGVLPDTQVALENYYDSKTITYQPVVQSTASLSPLFS